MRGRARIGLLLTNVFAASKFGVFGRSGLPQEFDEHAYLAANEDVARAVGTGQFKSGAEHWRRNGRYENRPLWPIPATRLETIDDAAPSAHRPVEASEGLDEAVADDPTKQSVPRFSQPLLDLSDRFDALAYAEANPDVAHALGVEKDALYQHWRAHGVVEGRTPYGLAPYRNRRLGPGLWKKRDGITVFGLFDATTGLGASARAYADAMRTAGFDVEAVTVKDTRGRFEIVPPDSENDGSRQRRHNSRVNVFHLNADMTHRFFIDQYEDLLDDSYNIAIWFWELAHFPQDWASCFGAYDEIWVSTEFARVAISAVSPVPVIRIPMPLPESSVETPLPRSHFALPDEAFLFGCIFDVGSVVERKNPAAAIKAFLDRFAGRNDVILVMKYHGAHHYPDALNEIMALADGQANIRFFDLVFTQNENHSFKILLDCIVSPHRSEGFGLNLAEGMMLGTSVIATGYSGNTDFMSADNSYLIDFTLAEVDRQAGPYPQGALWAEPDIRHLADLMSDVVDDRETARTKAERAREDIRDRHSTRIVADAIDRRMSELGLIGRSSPPFLTTWGAGVDQAVQSVVGDGPVISVIVPIRDVEPGSVRRCVDALLRQSHALWELVIYDDGSTRDDTTELLHRLRGSDPRIKVAFGETSRGCVAATNAAIELSSGTFLAFLDHDRELLPDALSQIVTAINADPSADSSGSRSAAYPHNLTVIRRSVLLSAGTVRDAVHDAQHDDRAPRAMGDARKVVRI